MYTDEHIKALAKEIGDRNYFPISDSTTRRGISIRFELLKTAMGGLCSSFTELSSWENEIVVRSINITNALLIQMAKDELGVKE